MFIVAVSFGAFYIWSFYTLAFYLLLNMLLAIVMDAYAQVQEEDSNASPILHDLRGIAYLWGRICFCHRGPKSFEAMADLATAHPGTQFSSAAEVGKVLQIKFAEAEFLFDEADEDVEEDEEHEANREPKMKVAEIGNFPQSLLDSTLNIFRCYFLAGYHPY